MRKLRLLILPCLALFILCPMVALALGQMSSPINIQDAQRGQQIHQEIIAVNSDNMEVPVEFSAEGDIKDWVEFFNPNDLENAVNTATIGATTNLKMTAIISVPEDTPNGEYKGFISVANNPAAGEDSDESSASVKQKIDREVTINVSDVETVSLDVSVIPETYDIGLNQPLKVRIIYDNQGNISLKPQIGFKIMQDENTVYNVIYPYPDGEPEVNSMARHEIPALEIPTNGLEKGKYLAQLEFVRNGETLVAKDFSFSIGDVAKDGSGMMNKNNILFIGLLIVIVIVAIIIIKKKKS